MKHKSYQVGGIALALLVPTAVVAQFQQPYFFRKGTAISASQLNKNFSDVYGKLNKLEGLSSRLRNLERQVAKGGGALYPNVKFGGDPTVFRHAVVGLRFKDCQFEIRETKLLLNPTHTDCVCRENEIALGGGAYSSGVNSSLRESRPLPGERNVWRVGCTTFTGGTKPTNTPIACEQAHVWCAGIEPSVTR